METLVLLPQAKTQLLCLFLRLFGLLSWPGAVIQHMLQSPKMDAQKKEGARQDSDGAEAR